MGGGGDGEQYGGQEGDTGGQGRKWGAAEWGLGVVGFGVYVRAHQLGLLKEADSGPKPEISPTVLEAGSPRSGAQRVWVLKGSPGLL
jgi:hypothetical protein